MTEAMASRVYPPRPGLKTTQRRVTLEFSDPAEDTFVNSGSDADEEEYWKLWNNYFSISIDEDGGARLHASGGENAGVEYNYPLDEANIEALEKFIHDYKKGGAGWQST